MKDMNGTIREVFAYASGIEGLTGAAIIETSHVVMHRLGSSLTPPMLQLDVYSCAEFDPEVKV
jgi:S-adenosylmethionine/arginine decarboxylase-like enzyme